MSPLISPHRLPAITTTRRSHGRIKGLAIWLAALTAAAPAARGALPVQYRDKPLAVHCLSESEIWIVGDHALVLHSSDGGESWQRHEVGTAQALTDVFFVNRMRGWVVGSQGTIFATKDGGGSWEAQESGVSEDLLGLSFVDTDRGFAVGHFATLIETEDGGETWTSIELTEGSVAEEDWEQFETQVFESPLLNDVFFVDVDHGWIVGEYGVVYATADGGTTWDRQETAQQAILFSVAFSNINDGVVVGLGGLILGTQDGGQTWSGQSSPTQESLYHVALVDQSGVVAGDAGTLLRSSDGGRSWSDHTSNPGVFGWLRGVATPDGEHFLAVGAHGLVLMSADRGQNWTRIQ